MPYLTPPPTPPAPRGTPPVPPSHVLRPFLERLRASAIAEANEISTLLGLPKVRQDRPPRERGDG